MDNNLIFGIRPVVEAIEAGREIEKLYIRKGAEGQLMTELRDLCLRHRVRVQEVPVEKLNRLVRGNHQGVVAQIAAIAYVQLDDILERVPDDETPLVVVFDGVTDVRNFGAIARSAECAGAHGLIAPLKNSAPVNAEAIRASAGALTTIPGEASFRFIGEAGASVYMLPQAVLGKHVHGDIDPHLWHDVHNAQAYVRVIRDSLISVDPDGEATYRANAAAYLTRLDELDATVASTIASIPEERRKLVTTNDAYAYLANAYGLTVAGFVAPNPSVEPSIADRIKLQATLSDSSIPAVFLEPNLARTRSTLRTAATDAGVDICPLYGDTLDDQAPTYIDMMEHNARSLARCLGGKEMP